MVRKRFQPPKTGIEWLKSVEYDKFFSKYGLGKKDFRFLKPMARGLMITYALGGACWWFNETSPLGWWTLKPMPKEEKELAHLYERKEYPYPGDKEAMDEFIANGGMIGTAVDPKGFVVFDRDGSSFQKEMQEQKFQGEANKLWIRMKNEVLTELHNKGFDVE